MNTENQNPTPPSDSPIPSPGGEGQGLSRQSAPATADEGERPSDQSAPDAPPSSARRTNAPAGLNLELCVLFYELEPRLLRDFIRGFQNDLLAKYPRLPQPCPGSDGFAEAVVPLLAAPKALPPRMHDALLAIQELAAPPNRQLLHGLLAQTGIRFESSALPEHLALEFWLQCPFLADGLAPLRAQLPAQFLNAPPSNPAGNNGAPTPHSAPCAPHSSVPGDLAAIARFPRNKISRLPANIRESINQMLRQRTTYVQIIEKLGRHGEALNKCNLSRWKKTGYLVWLAEQERREDAQAQIQLLFDLVRENENGKIHEATQQIAALRISQVLAGFDPATLIDSLQREPQALVRLVQTLPSLSRGGMDCERLLVEFAERKAALEQKQAQPKKRGISQQTLGYLEQKLKLL